MSSSPRVTNSGAPVLQAVKLFLEWEIPVKVLRLYWVGTRTAQHAATVEFFRDVLGLPIRHSEQDFAVLAVPDGSTVEIFGPASPYNRHLTSPAAGFLVDDLTEEAQELRDRGVEIVLPPQEGETGGWLHFRAPDGFIYELSQEWASS